MYYTGSSLTVTLGVGFPNGGRPAATGAETSEAITLERTSGGASLHLPDA